MSDFPDTSHVAFDRDACWTFHDAAARDPQRSPQLRDWHRKQARALESTPVAFDWKLLCQRARRSLFNLRYTAVK